MTYGAHAAERDEALPFRAFERAHLRRKRAIEELKAANTEVEKAVAGMLKAGYWVRDSEPGDMLAAKAPIPDERFGGEMGA